MIHKHLDKILKYMKQTQIYHADFFFKKNLFIVY